MRRIHIPFIVTAMVAPAAVAHAQDESRAQPPAFASGVTAGTIHYSGGRTDAGLSLALQYSPREWLTIAAAPGIGRTTLARTSSMGLTDIPVSAGASHSFASAKLAPAISASLYSSIALSNSTTGVGVGRSVVGAAGAVSAWVTDQLHLTLGASQPLTTNSGNGVADVETAYSLGRTTMNAGFSSEVGRADSAAVLSRSIVAGIAYSVWTGRPLIFIVDGSHGLSSSAPTWSLSAGFGTAFAGISAVTLASPLRRIKGVFGARATSTSGYRSSKGGCKRNGTC